MIYEKTEFVQHETEDADFPIKQIDRLQSRDESETRFIGRATLNMQTPMGVQQIPISFEIEADSVEGAFGKYADCARPRIEEIRQRLQERLQELRRQQENRIVTPGSMGQGPDANIIRFDDLKGTD
jgi:hypothetical protein